MSDLTKLIPSESEPMKADLSILQTDRRGFPPRYRSVTLSGSLIDDENRAAVGACSDWAAGAIENLLLWGAPGTGKTHLAAMACNKSLYPEALFISVPIMLLKFQSSVKDHDELELLSEFTKDARSYPPIKRARLFDDVGAHRVSDFSIEMFGLLLEQFYSHGAFGLIFTSNLSPKQILDTMGERVASRLRGLCEVVEVTGKDRRLSGEAAGLGKRTA